MDLQGTPIGNTATGTKVTSDPERYNRPVQEKPGAVTNDSLAAESVKHGGAFAQRNADAAPLDVSGSNSTLNNTNTSGASQLPSSRDAATRDPDSKGRYPDSLGGQGSYPGAHLPESGYVGGPSSAKKDLGIGQEGYPASQKGSQAEASGSGISSSHYGGAAPSYVEPLVHNPGSTKPKGNNLKEGGFDDSKNASWSTDIGSKNDPGRLAENTFERYSKESGVDAGYTKQRGREDPNSAQPYGALRNEERI
ncbi:hypothetical protein Plec18170_001111 [Paecilomyces lecythidis]